MPHRREGRSSADEGDLEEDDEEEEEEGEGEGEDEPDKDNGKGEDAKEESGDDKQDEAEGESDYAVAWDMIERARELFLMVGKGVGAGGMVERARIFLFDIVWAMAG